MLVPLLVIGLAVIYRKKLKEIIFKDSKTKFVSLILLLILIPILWSIFSPQALIRFRGTSTFTPNAHQALFDSRVLSRNKAVANHDIFGSLFYNQHLYPVVVLTEGYLSHFNPQWLFFNDGFGAFKAPFVGLLYLWQIPFILLGIIVLFFTKRLSLNSKLLIILWFLLGPLPASIATQTPHPMRSYNILPTWEIFTAIGISYLIFKFYKFKIITIGIISIFALLGLQSFYQNYFYTFPKTQSKSFQYAYGKAIGYVSNHNNQYSRVVISNTDNMFQSYMIFLFYTKYDPQLYRSEGGTISGGYAATHFFGKYEFRPIDWKKEKTENTMFVVNPNEVPTGSNVLFVAKYLDGSTGAVVLTR